MLTICPKKTSLTNIITNYVRKYNNTFKNSNMYGHIRARLLETKFRENFVRELNLINGATNDFTRLKICNGDNITEHCKLLRLFSSLYVPQENQLNAKPGQPCATEIQGSNSVIWYLLWNIIPYGIKPDIHRTL